MSSGVYRYGYNGMEKDSVTQDHYTSYFRQYDSRLGRFWSVDPVVHPGESPYAAMANNPISLIDPLGADTTIHYEDGHSYEYRDKDGQPYSVTADDGRGNKLTYYWDAEREGYFEGTITTSSGETGTLMGMGEIAANFLTLGNYAAIRYPDKVWNGFTNQLGAIGRGIVSTFSSPENYVRSVILPVSWPVDLGLGIADDPEGAATSVATTILYRFATPEGTGANAADALVAVATERALSPLGIASSSQSVVSNPLPSNGVFARAMPREYAELFLSGKGTMGANSEIFITAANDVADVTTIAGAQSRLALYSNYEGTIPRLQSDAIVLFRIKDLNSIGLRSPIETAMPRGYGFVHGGKAAGGAREWLINNGTADQLGIYDVRIVPLK